jgi:hypothetical protein
MPLYNPDQSGDAREAELHYTFSPEYEALRAAEIAAEEAAREAAEMAATAAWEARQEALERDLLAYEIAAGFRAPDGTLCDIGPARPFSERAAAGVSL